MEISSSSSSSSSIAGISGGSGQILLPSRSKKKLKALLRSRQGEERSVPKGHVCVYVGPRRERFVIPISYLSHSFFQIMLQQSRETFGFCEKGELVIPCRVPLFESVLWYMKTHNEQDLAKPVESYTLLKCVTDMNIYK